MIRLVGSSAVAASARATRSASETPLVGASLMANIRFARALGWTSRRLERQTGGARLYLVGAAPHAPSRGARRMRLR